VMADFIVFGPTWSVVVRANSYEQAKQRVLEANKRTARKPWLARDWVVRLATEEEVKAHEARRL
jgi:hypothetical protein